MEVGKAMRLFNTLIAGIALMAVQALAADINGDWKGTMPSRDGNSRRVSFHFKASGATLTGSFMGPMGHDVEISGGKVTEHGVAFDVAMDFNGSMVKIHYTGKFSGDELKMKMQRQGASRSVEFALKKTAN